MDIDHLILKADRLALEVWSLETIVAQQVNHLAGLQEVATACLEVVKRQKARIEELERLLDKQVGADVVSVT